MLPGVHRTRTRKPSGLIYTYWRAWRGAGAPLLGSFSGQTDAEVEAKERAAASDLAARYAAMMRPQKPKGFVSSLIADYKATQLPLLAASTQRVWRPHIDIIDDTFGYTSLPAIQRRGARKIIKAWHLAASKPDAAGVPTQPRTANIRLTVLTRILSWGVDEEILDRNPAAGIERLDEGPGRAGIIWSESELQALLARCTPEVARAVRLAALTGLRLGDVVKLRWDQVETNVIRRPTNKSRRRQRASIPLYPALRQLLQECPRVADEVITNTRGRAWKSADSFDSSLRPALTLCGVDKHFHDLRGTAATLMHRGGLSVRQIALALGWSERESEKRLNDYVDLDATARVLAAGPTLAHG